MRFEWDPKKAAANVRKHGIAFEEAETAFFDDDALIIADPDHSKDQDRFVLLGETAKDNLVVVCHCYLEDDGDDEVIRLISARPAKPAERRAYRERSFQ